MFVHFRLPEHQKDFTGVVSGFQANNGVITLTRQTAEVNRYRLLEFFGCTEFVPGEEDEVEESVVVSATHAVVSGASTADGVIDTDDSTTKGKRRKR